LRSRDMLTRVQCDFRQQADSDTTLRKLHDYIRDCGAVVCVLGKRSGACPSPSAAAPFAPMLPAGIEEASYTNGSSGSRATTGGGCPSISPRMRGGRTSRHKKATGRTCKKR